MDHFTFKTEADSLTLLITLIDAAERCSEDSIKVKLQTIVSHQLTCMIEDMKGESHES